MRKTKRTGCHIKYLSGMMAAIIGFCQPCAIMAAEQTDTVVADNVEAVKYITAFGTLAEEDAYLSCVYRPELEELLSVFPDTLSIQIEGEETVTELEVTWECTEDYDDTERTFYTFYPKWDETWYQIADAVKDSVQIPTIIVELPSVYGVISDLEEAKSSLQNILRKKSILALVYLCDKYEVKKSASQDSETISTVVCGQSVQITDVELDEYGSVWYQTLLYQNGYEYTGYVERGYLATSDKDFADWEDTYLDFSSMPALMTLSEGYPDVDQFPASYQNALYALKETHPNWIFVRMDTGVDWNTAIKNELGEKSLILSNTSASWQNGSFGQGWSYASEGILKYYMDPRNFLNDPSIFQFEQLTYNSSYHTMDAVQDILKNSFMSSMIPNDSQTYSQAFTDIGQSLGISPFHLASRVLQEQGTQGNSPLISGTYAGYEGFYNYFNISASGKTNMEVIQNGLKKAVEQGWNTRYKSLYGGAYVIGINYILKGQDTLYLEKFNVSNGRYTNFTHQYMQNIQAPALEASNIRKAYHNAGALENSFVFKIPVYNNMPASACSKPETIDTVTLDKTTVDDLEVGKTVTLIPYVNGSKVDNLNHMVFDSDNTSVASVDSQGKITAISPGTAVISCTLNGVNTASCTVTVVKADSGVPTPVLSPIAYQEGLKLSDIALPEGWEWVNGSTLIMVGTFSYSAVYTPADTVKYNTVTKEIEFTVTKAIPACRVPSKLEAESGTVLGSIMLPDGFAWESNTETELTRAGEHIFYVSYNPDENNYYTVDHIPVIVRVIKNDSEASGNGQIGAGSGGNGSTSGSSTVSGETSNNSTSTDITSGSSTMPDGTLSGTTSTDSTSDIGTSGNSTTISSTSTSSTPDNSAPTDNTPSSSTSTGSKSPNRTETEGIILSVLSSLTGNYNHTNNTSTTDNQGYTGNTTSSSGTGSGTGNVANGSAPVSSENDINVDNTQTNSAPTANTANTSGSDRTTEKADNASKDNAVMIIDPQPTIIEENQPEEEEEVFFKPSVTIQMEDTTILTVEKLRMAKEQGFDIRLDMGNYITWNIDVDSLDLDKLTTVDMGVTVGTDNTPQELIAAILNGNKFIEITLAHDGSFGFNPVMNIALNPENYGRYANLFYYNQEGGTLEFICDTIIDANGIASFSFGHASCYVIIVSDQSMSGVPISDDSANHTARWIIIGVLIFMVLVVVGQGVFFCLRKRQEAEEDEENDDDEEASEEDDFEEEYLDDEDELDEIEIEEIDIEEMEEETEESEEAEEIEEADESDEEDDWIEDKDWHEPEMPKQKKPDRFDDDHAEDDWIEDDEWDIGNDWMDDAEWEKKRKV